MTIRVNLIRLLLTLVAIGLAERWGLTVWQALLVVFLAAVDLRFVPSGARKR